MTKSPLEQLRNKKGFTLKMIFETVDGKEIGNCRSWVDNLDPNDNKQLAKALRELARIYESSDLKDERFGVL